MQMTRQYFDVNKLADIEAMIKSRIKNCSKTGHEANEEGAGEFKSPRGKDKRNQNFFTDSGS